MAGRIGNQAPFKYYFDTLSQPCRALQIFFKSAQIPYEPKIVKLSKLEHMSEEFGELNPFHKVPVIDDNGFVLTESVAIFRYVCRSRKISGKWYPSDDIRRAKVDEYLEWQHIGLRAPCALYAWAMFFTPQITGKPVSPKQVENRKIAMIKACDDMNDIWLKDKLFVAGNEISFADVLAACELQELMLTDYDPKEGRPALKAWMDRVREETNPHYDEALSRIVSIVMKKDQAKL